MAKDIKETQFFNENYEKGVGWYEKFFENCEKSLAVGEISNRYIFNSDVPDRIRKLIPDCKIIICLRNPYERIQSVYSFKLREGSLNCSFEEALEEMPELIYENRYYSLSKPYYDLFPQNNIFILFYDDLINRPLGLCRRLFNFLEIDKDFVPSVIDKKINVAVVPRFPMAALMTKGAATFMRKVHFYSFLTWAKRSDKIKTLFFKAYNYKKGNLLTEKTRAMIDPIVLPEIDKIENLVGRALDEWKKPYS